MKKEKALKISLIVIVSIFLATSFLLTFTVSDYYIFNRISFLNSKDSFSIFFVLSQWIKKLGLLFLPLAVFYNRKSCSDIAKWILPIFIVISCFTFGSFFDITMVSADASVTTNIFAKINEFIPKWLNITLFFIAATTELAACVLLFIRDGYKAKAKSFIYLPVAMLVLMPLNFLENFYNKSNFTVDSFLWFKPFSLWHILAAFVLIGVTIGAYYFLRKKDKKTQSDYLVAIALIMLIQYHSKMSMVMGDGYSTSHTIFACLPLYICNIGVYVAALSVILKKRVLYSISFFVHAAGALIVFAYPGRVELSDFGIFCSYSTLYFCYTHVLLFLTSVLPTALGHYKFKFKDAIIPMLYYCVVIVVAAVASGIVTSASMGFSFNGGGLPQEDWIIPNYSFTQENPLPVPVYNIPFKIWKYEFNLLYLIILYIVYIGLFWGFIGAYYAFLAIRKKCLAKKTAIN